MQIAESVAAYGRHVPLRSAVVYGGVPIEPQIKELRAGVEILVATPGRLMDHVGQRTVNLSQVEILVLDEADRMLDMGFIPDIRKIVALLPAQRQNLLFSATFSDEIRRLSKEFLHDPETVEVVRPEHRRRGRGAGPLPGRSRPQGGPADPPHPARPDGAGPRLHPDQAGRQPAGLVPRSARGQRGRDPLGPQPARADPGARGLQARRGDLPRRHRRRVARARHRGAAVRRQLRAPVRGPGLHPPDRPDRPGGLDRDRHLARLHGRGRAPAGPSSGCSRRRSRSGWSRASSRTRRSRHGRSAVSVGTVDRAPTGAATTPTTSRSEPGRPAAAQARREPPSSWPGYGPAEAGGLVGSNDGNGVAGTGGLGWASDTSLAVSGRRSTPFWLVRTAIASPRRRQVAQLAPHPDEPAAVAPRPPAVDAGHLDTHAVRQPYGR